MEIEETSILMLLFILLISLFSTFIFFKTKVQCTCATCHAYITSSWSLEFNNLCDWYTHLLKNSPTQTIHIHVLHNTITSNHQNVEYMLKTRFENYPKGKPFSAILGDFLGRGIFNVDGDSWRFQRKMACLELGKMSMRSHAFDVVNDEIVHRLIPLVSSRMEKGVLDLQDVFRRFSFDVICKFSFGYDPKCLDEALPMSELAIAFDLASQLSAQRAMSPLPITWKIKRLLNVGSEKRLKESINLVDIFANEVIRQRDKLGSSCNHEDLLSRFMATTKDPNYLRDIVISFLLAGRDTVASSLTGLFWLLAQQPEVVDNIRAEALKVTLNKACCPTSFEQLHELHYLRAVVYEGMRLFPPIQFNSKFCVQDDTLPDGTFVKKGTRVTYHSYAMGRMETIWGCDSLEFKPERWLRDGVFHQETAFKYPVFQAGYRTCLGKEMALVEITSVILSVFQRFDVELVSPSRTPRFSPGLTATFSDGLPVRVSERTVRRSLK